MKAPYTVIIRKSRLQYVGVCLELNVSACGDTIQDIENNLKNAIELYLKDIDEHPDTVVSPVTTEELIEFFQDTVSDERSLQPDKFLFRPFEIHEAPSYV